eukprot:jgi/Tetstr1/459512/TSEL_004879.t1
MSCPASAITYPDTYTHVAGQRLGSASRSRHVWCVTPGLPRKIFEMVHGSFTAGKTAQEPSLGELPQDIIFEIVTRLDVRSKCRALSVRRDWADFLALPHHWGQLVFRSASEQRGLRAADLLRLAQRSKQSLQALCFCRSSKSEAQQTADRVQQGWKYRPPSPVQLTLPPLASCLANLAHLSLDERTSCLGGMSDQMATLLAQHAPGLVTLDLFFVPYSRASEMFTDEGMCTLAEGCTQLQSLTLHNTGITNRALYSLAHHSRALRDLEIEGYSEFITNTGVAVVAQARPGLRRCHLGGRLLKVGNSAIESIARFCPDLESLSVSGGATDDALVSLSSGACLSRLQTIARGQGVQQNFTGRVRKWTKKWVTSDSAGAGSLRLLRWVPTEERYEDGSFPRFPHLVAAENLKQQEQTAKREAAQAAAVAQAAATAAAAKAAEEAAAAAAVAAVAAAEAQQPTAEATGPGLGEAADTGGVREGGGGAPAAAEVEMDEQAGDPPPDADVEMAEAAAPPEALEAPEAPAPAPEATQPSQEGATGGADAGGEAGEPTATLTPAPAAAPAAAGDAEADAANGEAAVEAPAAPDGAGAGLPTEGETPKEALVPAE